MEEQRSGSRDLGEPLFSAVSASRETGSLTVTGLTVRYGGIKALEAVSFTAPRGEVMGLIGPNGAGKTTLFDAISGHASVSAGRIDLGNVEITNWSPTRRARAGIRRTFQRQQIFGSLTVEENVLCATEWRGGGGGLVADLLSLPPRRQRERNRRADVTPILDQCGLLSHRHRVAGTLPIGLARLVEVARVIAGRPSVMLLDEPTSGLSDREANLLKPVLSQAAAEGNCAMLVIEHDVSFLMECSDNVLVLDLGEVLEYGPPSKIQNSPSVRSAYLG